MMNIRNFRKPGPDKNIGYLKKCLFYPSRDSNGKEADSSMNNHTGKIFVLPIKTSSPVVELVKLMAWRQAKSLMNIPVC